MRKIALVNHKGGVGKTTSCTSIATAIANKRNRCLIIDCDPQSNLTQSFGISEAKQNIYQSFSKGIPLPLVKINKYLDLVPSTLDLAGLELEIASRFAREKILKELIEPLENDYEYCIFDAPPSLGLITLNVLVATDEVYIPMLAEYFSYTGIDSIVGIIEQVRKHYNEKLKIRGVFFTKYNARKVLSRGIVNELQETMQEVLMKTQIRDNVSLAESQSMGKDIFSYDAKSNGAKDYVRLTNEILKS